MNRLVRERVAPHLGRLALGGVAMLAVAAATATNAWLMEPMLDKVFVQKDAAMLWLIPLAIVAVAVIKAFATYLQSVIMNRVGQRIIAELQRDLFRHLMRADLQFFHDNPTGALISRVTSDVNLLRGAVTQGVTGLIKDACTALGLVGVMFYQDWRLAIAASLVIPIALVPSRKLGRRMRKVSGGFQESMGEFTTLLDETFQGARHVKAYGMEGYESKRADGLIERLFRLVTKAQRTRAASTPIMEVLGAMAIAITVLYGGSQVLAGETTPGAFFSFVTALMLAFQPIKSLANLHVTVQEGLAAAERVFAALDLPPAIRDRDGARPLPAPVRGEVRFERVGFAYADGSPVLEGFDLAVPAGRTVAIVGSSGAGKSTVLNLLPRFYDVGAGRVTVDGVDVRDTTLASLRGAIAIVSQETTLFHDTVHANVIYGRPGAADDAVRRAIELAGAAAFVDALPEGWHTIVGARGAKLSGGQRQRIAIARAILKDAPILLLDEATSALDAETERQVQAALAILMRDRTTFVVAHRLSTVIDADQICVLEGGRIAELGRHAELLARGGAYARLYAAQSADDPVAGESARARA